MTDIMTSNITNDLIRTVLMYIFDKPAYALLKVMYEVFFNIANLEILGAAEIKDFYGRVQLIIGVIMVFKLSITILQAIVNPDKVTTKQTGMMSIIGRVFIVLILLTLLTPLNINPRNGGKLTDYEEKLRDNGIIFGVLYSLQSRILNQDTIGKLVLGNKGGQISFSKNAQNADKRLEQSANRFSKSILKVFVKINLVKGAKDSSQKYWACTKIDQGLLDMYEKDDTSPGDVLNFITLSCDEADTSQGWQKSPIIIALKKITKIGVSQTYAFAYFPVLGGVVAFILAFVFLGFSIDVAIRAFKLAALRLIAPIPIISYVNPSKDNGAFGAWVKNLTSTYIELFIRLAVVYFIVNMIDGIITSKYKLFSGVVGGSFVRGICYVMIVLGLFIFARQAPKFIKDAIGIKGGSSSVGLSAMLGGAAMIGGSMRTGAQAARATGGSALLGALTGGARGFAQGALAGERGAVDAYNQGKQMPLGTVWRQNQDLMEQIRTGDKDAHGGFVGRLQDRLDYGNREKGMAALGLDKTTQAQADWNKKQAQIEAAQRQETLKRAEEDLSAYSTQVSSGAATFNQAHYNRLLAAVRTARADYDAAELSATKAKKNADNIDKYRSAARTNPRVIDNVTETYRSGEEVVKNPPVLDANNHPTRDRENYNSAGQPFDQFKR